MSQQYSYLEGVAGLIYSSSQLDNCNDCSGSNILMMNGFVLQEIQIMNGYFCVSVSPMYFLGID